MKGVGKYGGKGGGGCRLKRILSRLYVGVFKGGGGPVATSLYMFKYANKVKYAYGKGVCNSFIYYSF